MGTISDKLTYLNATKTAIKEALTAKGVTVADTDTFRSYADKIGTIGTAPTGSLSITSNGTYDVTDYASAEVNVASSGDSSDVAGITIDNMFTMESYGLCTNCRQNVETGKLL